MQARLSLELHPDHTIYAVIHATGGYTAWSDKHAVYASVSGPGSNASNVDDYYSPEVNSSVIPLPGVTTATGNSCAIIRDTAQVGSWTDSFLNIQCYELEERSATRSQMNPNGNRNPSATKKTRRQR